jgi:hypothetical protein
MNPWEQLPKTAPFVLDADRPALTAFNSRAKPRQAVDTSLLPEPFLGRPKAPVVLLGLNPGWSPDDADWHNRPDFARLCRANVLHESSQYPFYLLNPAVASSPGGRWWRQRLRAVIHETNLECTSRGLMCVEYFPYHSDTYSGATPRLQSQEYGFQLVRAAMGRGAIIVILRSEKRWCEAIPDLCEYSLCYRLRSVQYVSISPRNCPEGFESIVAALRQECEAA